MKNTLYGLILFTLLLGCKNTDKDNGSEELPEKLVDRIQLVDLDGNEFALASLKGKTIFLNFWATWCRPCLAEMPDIDKAAKLLKDEDIVFLAASDEDLDKIKQFAAKSDFSFQFVRSKTSVFDLDITALPTTMIIDSDGEIVFNEVGARDWSSDNEIINLRKLHMK